MFQGRYKAILVEAVEYLVKLSRYIHLNPAREKIVERSELYPWSSYQSYIDLIKPPEWLRTGFILGCFSKKTEDARKKYRTFVEDRLDKEYESSLTRSIGTSILGSAAFVEEISSVYIQGKVDLNIPTLRQFANRLDPGRDFEGSACRI